MVPDWQLLDLSRTDGGKIEDLLDGAEKYRQADGDERRLAGASMIQLFFEGSTRTRTSFQIAGQRLGAEVVNFDVDTSSTSKGEILKDTIHTIRAMQPDIFILRHGSSGAASFVGRLLQKDRIGLVNAGDGAHAHPTQALADLLTIKQTLIGSAQVPDWSSLRLAIVGDVSHSRVARSLAQALQAVGVKDIRAVGPPTLVQHFAEGVRLYNVLDDAIRDVDVVVALRLQAERMEYQTIPSVNEYFRFWGITEERMRLAADHAILMHPGPINRGGDLSSAVADGVKARILDQVANGVAVRMAVLERVFTALRGVA